MAMTKSLNLNICVSGQSGSSNTAEDAIDNLKAKLESGESLTKEEVTQMREYIDSLRGTAEFLLQTAAELEAKLLQNIIECIKIYGPWLELDYKK